VFDIGFSEMMLIGLVALVVIGPERLPKVARTVGTMLGRMQRYVNDVKAEVEREMRIEEIRKLQGNIEEQARSLERTVTTEMNEAEHSIRRIADDPVAETATPAEIPPEHALESSNQGQLELGLGDGAAAPKRA
jgi:sec-independent protein translocase protein TatB